MVRVFRTQIAPRYSAEQMNVTRRMKLLYPRRPSPRGLRKRARPSGGYKSGGPRTRLFPLEHEPRVPRLINQNRRQRATGRTTRAGQHQCIKQFGGSKRPRELRGAVRRSRSINQKRRATTSASRLFGQAEANRKYTSPWCRRGFPESRESSGSRIMLVNDRRARGNRRNSVASIGLTLRRIRVVGNLLKRFVR